MCIRDRVDTAALTTAFLDQGILTKETRSRTFRFAPPLTLSEDELEDIVSKIAAALRSVAAPLAVAT